MNERLEFVDVNVSWVKAVTAKAVLVVLETTGDEKWIPRSNLSTKDDDTIYAGMERQTIRVVDWFAKKEGLA